MVLYVAGFAGHTSAFALVGGLLGLITLGCYVVLWVWYCERGTLGPNRFGPDPLSP
jgi:uncharacterized membrane protein YhaH (DUF805 family)